MKWVIRITSALAVAAIATIIASITFASSSSNADWSNTPEPYTLTYLGHPLHCFVTEDGATAGNIGGISCDYTRYWRARR